MFITINGKQITLTETKNVYQTNLTPIKGSKEFEILMKSKYAKKAYLVFPKSDPRITPENIQIWCDKTVNKQLIPVITITEFFPTRGMIAYQALILFPSGEKKCFYKDLRDLNIENELRILIGTIVNEIHKKVPQFKLNKLIGEGNFLQARKTFLSAA